MVNDERLFNFEQDQDGVFADLSTQLKDVDHNLTFEFGPDIDGKREFVISAGGIRRSFSAVEALANAAPGMDRWDVVRFRPRRPDMGELGIGGQTIAPRDIEFALQEDDGKAGIFLFIDGYSDTNANLWSRVGFLFLDMALGEYDVEMKVGFIEFKPFAFRSDLERHPVTELADTFDEFMDALEEPGR